MLISSNKFHEHVILVILQKDIPESMMVGLLQAMENPEEDEVESYRFTNLWQSFLAAKYLASLLSEGKVQHTSNAYMAFIKIDF